MFFEMNTGPSPSRPLSPVEKEENIFD